MSIAATMRALQQTSLNGQQDMHLITDAPVPSPGPGEAPIRVTAAEVNRRAGQVSRSVSETCAVSNRWSVTILSERAIRYVLSRRRERRGGPRRPAQQVPNGHGLASCPSQSPGFGPPITACDR